MHRVSTVVPMAALLMTPGPIRLPAAALLMRRLQATMTKLPAMKLQTMMTRRVTRTPKTTRPVTRALRTRHRRTRRRRMVPLAPTTAAVVMAQTTLSTEPRRVTTIRRAMMAQTALPMGPLRVTTIRRTMMVTTAMTRATMDHYLRPRRPHRTRSAAPRHRNQRQRRSQSLVNQQQHLLRLFLQPLRRLSR